MRVGYSNFLSNCGTLTFELLFALSSSILRTGDVDVPVPTFRSLFVVNVNELVNFVISSSILPRIVSDVSMILALPIEA